VKMVISLMKVVALHAVKMFLIVKLAITQENVQVVIKDFSLIVQLMSVLLVVMKYRIAYFVSIQIIVTSVNQDSIVVVVDVLYVLEIVNSAMVPVIVLLVIQDITCLARVAITVETLSLIAQLVRVQRVVHLAILDIILKMMVRVSFSHQNFHPLKW